ncbi:MAG: hypothetical protein QOD80_459 [Verrucomicrobiota bacterium]
MHAMMRKGNAEFLKEIQEAKNIRPQCRIVLESFDARGVF